jgi:hypothetical protein
MVLGGVLRSVAGWKADKYQFDVQIHSAYNLLPGTKALQVQWKRGSKSTATKPVKAQRGEALWEEELSLVCTMFINPKTSTYEPKPAMFVVKEILDAPLKELVYAEAVVDLLEFAMQPGRTIRRTLPLARGKKTLPSHIIFSVKATPLREGVALSEVSSNVSIADLAEVEEVDLVEVEQTTFEQHRRMESAQTTTAAQSRVVTVTTTAVGHVDETTGAFKETSRTRDAMVQEAMETTMTGEQRIAFEAMEERRRTVSALERGVVALRDSLRPDTNAKAKEDDSEEDDTADLVPISGVHKREPTLPLANAGRQAGMYVPPVLYDAGV